MCLAIPGRISALHDNLGIPMARVDFGGTFREACLSYLPEARIGDYVLVHVGFAISRVDEEEAARTYACLAELDQLAELQDGEEDPPEKEPEEQDPARKEPVQGEPARQEPSPEEAARRGPAPYEVSG
jgi:hydrogenase expression/formation protein HypC